MTQSGTLQPWQNGTAVIGAAAMVVTLVTVGYTVVRYLLRSPNASNSRDTDFASFLKDPKVAPGQHRSKQRQAAHPAPKATDFAAFLKQSPQTQQPQVRPTSFAAFLKTSTQADAPGSDSAAHEDESPAKRMQPHHIPMPVLFGTEYGFCKEIAEKLCQHLRSSSQAFWPIMLDMADLGGGGFDFTRYQVALVICSTQGDGVPPSEARAFCDWLNGPGVPTLAQNPSSGADSAESGPLGFAVLAAGDKSYIHFCACGKMLDARLEALGGRRLCARADLNKEDWRSVDAWIADVVGSVQSLRLKSAAELGGGMELSHEGGEAKPRRWGKARPYWGKITEIESLCAITHPDDRDTVRVSVDLGDSGLSYTPGDALGIYPTNNAQAAEEILQELGLRGDEQVAAPSWHYEDARAESSDQKHVALRDALTKCYDLRSPRANLLDLLLSLDSRDDTDPSSPDPDPSTPADSHQPGSTSRAEADSPRPSLHDSAHSLHGNGHLGNANEDQRQLLENGGKAGSLSRGQRKRLKLLLLDEAAAEAYFAPRHVIDILQDFAPPPLLHTGASSASGFIPRFLGCLRPLLPRLYSISSSMREDPRSVQITVAAVRYDSLGRARAGVASNFLASGCVVGDEVPVYVSVNPDFRLPPNPATPLILVGPGTGLAPFRAFMQERLLGSEPTPPAADDSASSDYPAPGATDDSASTADSAPAGGGSSGQSAHPAEETGTRHGEQGAHPPSSEDSACSADSAGSCLLFFGCRRRDQDYLYKELLERWHREGAITLFTAFSREQARKVYVQQRLREAGDQVWELLERGGHFYVCGDAGSMAGAVEEALLDIITQHGEEASLYLDALSTAKRYQRDIWL